MSNLVSLDMYGHIGDVMTTGKITKISFEDGAYIDGVWVEGVETQSDHVATVQPLTPVEAKNLNIGGNRVSDYKKIYINDGTVAEVNPQDEFIIDGIRYKLDSVDNRPTRNYCKIVAFRKIT